MLYVSKDYKDGTYGITDTDDDSETRYILSDVINVMKLENLQVKGVSLKYEKVIRVFRSRQDLIDDFIIKAKLLRSLDICYDSKTEDYILRGKIKQGITSFEVPYGVTAIADEFFADCKTLESVVLPDTLKVLGDSCFMSCTSLKSINIPNNIKEIPRSCFADCSSLSGVGLPDSLESIEFEAFTECTDLEYIVLPDSLTQLKFGCFSKCTSLRYVKLPMHLEAIGFTCFSGCIKLEDLEIPYGLKTIGADAFSGCFNLRHISIPSTVEALGYCCFKGCALESVILPESLISLDDECFADIPSLTFVRFAEGTNASEFRIGKNCFAYCQNLKSIEMPKAVFENHENAVRLDSFKDIIKFI